MVIGKIGKKEAIKNKAGKKLISKMNEWQTNLK
jgi:hypothetical protein